MTKIEFTHKDADSLRRTVVQLTATLKGIELQLNRIAESTSDLSAMQLDLEGLRYDLTLRSKAEEADS